MSSPLFILGDALLMSWRPSWRGGAPQSHIGRLMAQVAPGEVPLRCWYKPSGIGWVELQPFCAPAHAKQTWQYVVQLEENGQHVVFPLGGDSVKDPTTGTTADNIALRAIQFQVGPIGWSREFTRRGFPHAYPDVPAHR